MSVSITMIVRRAGHPDVTHSLMEYFEYFLFPHLDYPLFFPRCRFRVPVGQRRAINGGFAAKVFLD